MDDAEQSGGILESTTQQTLDLVGVTPPRGFLSPIRCRNPRPGNISTSKIFIEFKIQLSYFLLVLEETEGGIANSTTMDMIRDVGTGTSGNSKLELII